MAASLHETIKQQLLSQLSTAKTADTTLLNNALRLLAKWRSVLIQNTVLQKQGTVVQSGVLAGLDFIEQSAEGCHIAKLLGCYEQPLQPAIAQAIEASYQVILNIGCAEGYYAVGMARKMPHTRVLAFDLDAAAQRICKELAAKNAVSDRVEIGALFRPGDFAHYADQRALVLCDIEGAEGELLDPAQAPALKRMDLIVESHECLFPGTTRLLIERFVPTHDIKMIEDNGQRSLNNMPDWFRNMAHLDQLLAVWEWRSGPTPWLVMTPRSPEPR